ncbi:unnamed protein product, partial [Acanthocheilonema viteae]
SRDEIESAVMVLPDASDTSVVLHRKLTNSTPGQHANSVPNHSPNAPEESHTACLKTSTSSSMSILSMDAGDTGTGTALTSNGLVKQDQQTKLSVAIASAALPCAICGQSFPDAFALQRHWLSHVCDRPHICKQCDAGFTTADALNTHTLTHQNNRRER